ncbi:MAG: DUF4097 family beta strand repeat protein [Gemmatimonadales bacterium]|nr:MAG: DUF4097 family beta strand repeat protein [Gemmatimonadales bacterium]
MRASVMATTIGCVLAVTTPLQSQESYGLAGDRVAVYNLAGQVEVVAGGGGEVTVQVLAGGDDAERLSVEVSEIRGMTTLRVLYPDDQVVYRPEGRGRFRTTLRVREDGTFGGGMGGDRVEIRSGGSGLEAHADLRIVVPAGRSLDLHNAVGEVTAQGLDGDLRVDVSSGPIRVTDITGNVELDTGSGSVEARGIQGELEVDTGSGSVTIEDVDGPWVMVDTGSGGVQGTAIRADRLEVDTGSGRVELMALAAPDVTVDTGSGGVELEFTASVENLEVDTGSGGVTVRLPADLNAEIEVDTGSGGIDVDFPVEVETMRRNYFSGVVGNGRGRIVIDTGSGGVRLLGSR